LKVKWDHNADAEAGVTFLSWVIQAWLPEPWQNKNRRTGRFRYWLLRDHPDLPMSDHA
jgi:hypothetical protein